MRAKKRCTRTITTLPPIVAKKAEPPLMTRDRTDARMTMSTIKRRLAGERALMPHPNHGQRRKKNNDSAERDLEKGQILRLRAQTEKWSDKTVERVHA